ncbi:Rhamnogalacturonate lyase A [Sphaerosporella brunnea]|uniref:rhamnogalacturonan endolyase n=1 Tax=Sphaerosporella brunnea TaxID=1250544 RepID=A0A5J5EVI4_9PEZI|nr:Rhamnogalacturonate lyase A [Sphaerosporella brunnea]
MRFSILLAALLAGPSLAAFGVTDTNGRYVVDTDGGLVFTVNKSTGDIISLKYNGVEAQDSSKFSQIASGLGSSNVVATTVSSTVIKITVTTSTLTQYYIAQSGSPAVYMGTYITAEPSVGELRFIARLKKSTLPSGVPYAETSGGKVIEGGDVFLVNGQTRSKFYSSIRFIEDAVHCVSGQGMAACMAIGNYESSSGGPFHRDIDNQGSDQQELYFYMNSGHVQTEAYRMGFHGPYALVFTGGSTASVPDFSFFESCSLTGYVNSAARGKVAGTVSGVSDGVVHWYNAAAQYWVTSSGAYTSPAMKPGAYTMVLYETELAVATATVTVQAGATASADLASTRTTASALFRIGAVDGQPTGFKNAANQLIMHPSDSRMASWGPTTFTWGTSSVGDFPMAQVKGVNDATTIVISLSASDAATARTLTIYTTLSFSGGRPSVTVNGDALSVPAAPAKIDSRGFTRGAYRGYGEQYSFTIAAGKLVAGANSIAISCVSGSSGTGFLNPNFIYDAVELV